MTNYIYEREDNERVFATYIEDNVQNAYYMITHEDGTVYYSIMLNNEEEYWF